MNRPPKNPHAVALGKRGGANSGGARPGAGRKAQYVNCPRCGASVTKTISRRAMDRYAAIDYAFSRARNVREIFVIRGMRQDAERSRAMHASGEPWIALGMSATDLADGYYYYDADATPIRLIAHACRESYTRVP